MKIRGPCQGPDIFCLVLFVFINWVLAADFTHIAWNLCWLQTINSRYLIKESKYRYSNNVFVSTIYIIDRRSTLIILHHIFHRLLRNLPLDPRCVTFSSLHWQFLINLIELQLIKIYKVLCFNHIVHRVRLDMEYGLEGLKRVDHRYGIHVSVLCKYITRRQIWNDLRLGLYSPHA